MSPILEAVKEKAISMAISQTMKAIAVKWAWTAVGIFNPIVSFFVGKVIRVMLTETALGLSFWGIDKATDAEAEEFDKKDDTFKEALKNGNEEEIAKAEQEAIDAFRKLVRFGPGTTKPSNQ